MWSALIACLLLTGAVGCRDPDDAWAAWRRACGTTNVLAPSPWDPDGAGLGITADCAARIGDDLGMDWASFGSEPHDLDFVERPDDAVIAGAWVLATADLGDWGDLKSKMLPTEALAVNGEAALGRSLASDQPAGRVWVAWLLANTEVVDFEPETDNTVVARYSNSGIHWVYSDWAIADDAEFGPQNPALAAETLIHEATHGLGERCLHEGRDTSSYDADPSCAFGAGIRFVDEWRTNAHGDSWFGGASEAQRATCRMRIQDRVGFTACAEYWDITDE